MSVGGCGDASAVPGTALQLFQLAALLMGDQLEAVKLVEETLASVEIDPCQDPTATRRLTSKQLLQGALAKLQLGDPRSFASVPDAAAASAVCVEDEDLSLAGVSHAQLTEWLATEGREDLRAWLAALPAARRAIFVQRAVLGQGNAETAESMQAAGRTDAGDNVAGHGGPGWTPQAVGETYRLALCSLANSLAHSPAGLAEVHSPVATSARL